MELITRARRGRGVATVRTHEASSSAVAVADDELPDHELGVDRRTADVAVMRLELLVQVAESHRHKHVLPPQQVVLGNAIFEPELAEQTPRRPSRLLRHSSHRTVRSSEGLGVRVMSNEQFFQGRIGRTIADSTPHWPEETKTPVGAPNILVVLFDGRTHYVLHAGMGHVPNDVAPDVRSRSYLIEAFVELIGRDQGALIAHGDATSGYSLYVQGGCLVHDMNVGGEHVIARSDVPIPASGAHRLSVRVRRLSRIDKPTLATGPGTSEVTLLIDGNRVGRLETMLGFPNFVSWSGLDIGRDRGSPVSHYEAPFAFTGRLIRVEVTMDLDQMLDGEGMGNVIMSKE